MSDALTALRLQLEWGADEALDADPHDRFAAGPAAPERPGSAAPPPAAPVLARATLPPLRPAAAAPRGETLEALYAEMQAFEGCPLRATASSTVRPDGTAAAALVVIGDAPPSDDDRSGVAFSGAAGQRCDRIFASIGLERADIIYAPLVPWRPPGDRKLTDTEIQVCLPFVRRLIGIVRPRCLLLLGAAAAAALTGDPSPIRRRRGRFIEVKLQDEQLTIPTLILPPVDQWLSNAASKQQLWNDLLLLRSNVRTV